MKKKNCLLEYSKLLRENKMIIICHYSPLSVPEWTSLRDKLNMSGIGLKVVKNTLFYKACNDMKLKPFNGPTCIAYSNDFNPSLLTRLFHDSGLLVLAIRIYDKSYREIPHIVDPQRLLTIDISNYMFSSLAVLGNVFNRLLYLLENYANNKSIS